MVLVFHVLVMSLGMWFVETVIPKQPSKAILFHGRGKFVKMMAGNYSYENFGKVKISQDPTIRFEFPFVQSEIRS